MESLFLMNNSKFFMHFLLDNYVFVIYQFFPKKKKHLISDTIIQKWLVIRSSLALGFGLGLVMLKSYP